MAQEKTTSLMAVSHTIVDPITKRIPDMLQSHELLELGGYSAVSAIKSAELALPNITDGFGDKVLEKCTALSIQNALLNMLKAYADVSKGQCFFIPYRNKKTGQYELQMQLSSEGWAMQAMLFDPTIKNVTANVVWKGDDFKEEVLPNGKHRLVSHSSNPFGSRTVNDIVGAYCIIERTDGTAYIESLVTFEQLKKMWNQSSMHPIDEKGNIKETSNHYKFPEEMAKKSVVAKACRPIVKRIGNGNPYARQAMGVIYEEEKTQAQDEIDANVSSGEVVDIADDTVMEVIDVPTEDARPEPTENSDNQIGMGEMQGLANPFDNMGN